MRIGIIKYEGAHAKFAQDDQFYYLEKLLQVVRCCIEHSASVAKAFLTSSAVVVERKELKPIPIPRRKPMPTSGNELDSLPIPRRKPMPMPMPMATPGNKILLCQKVNSFI